MIGSRIGSKGVLLGSKVGSGADDEGGIVLVGVTQDATSLIYAPNTAGEWTTARTAMGLPANPTRLWRLQEAAGNPADSIGPTTLTASGVVTYQQNVTGWSRKAIMVADGGASFLFNNTDATLPNVSAAPMLLLVYAAVTATPAAERTIAVIGDGNGVKANFTTTPRYRAYWAGNNATGGSSPGTGVLPLILQADPANNIARIITSQEVITPTWTAGTSAAQALFLGGAVELAAATLYLYGCAFTGAGAQLSLSQIRTMLQTLGFPVSW